MILNYRPNNQQIEDNEWCDDAQLVWLVSRLYEEYEQSHVISLMSSQFTHQLINRSRHRWPRRPAWSNLYWFECDPDDPWQWQCPPVGTAIYRFMSFTQTIIISSISFVLKVIQIQYQYFTIAQIIELQYTERRTQNNWIYRTISATIYLYIYVCMLYINLKNLKFTFNVRTIITLRKQQKLFLHDFVAISAR